MQTFCSYTRVFCLGLVLTAASTLAVAQQQAGEAVFTVVTIDSNRAVVSSAQVTLQCSENFRQTLLTNQRGEATFIKLRSGRCRLLVEAEYFEPHEREITLKTGSQQIIIRLEVARIKDGIVVGR